MFFHSFHAVILHAINFHAVNFHAVNFHSVNFYAVNFHAVEFHAVEFQRRCLVHIRTNFTIHTHSFEFTYVIVTSLDRKKMYLVSILKICTWENKSTLFDFISSFFFLSQCRRTKQMKLVKRTTIFV